jgi:hypothetical protein
VRVTQLVRSDATPHAGLRSGAPQLLRTLVVVNGRPRVRPSMMDRSAAALLALAVPAAVSALAF